VAYTTSIIAEDSTAKLELLDESLQLQRKELKALSKAPDELNSGKVCLHLMASLSDRLEIEWDAETREEIIGEALDYGKKAIEIFSQTKDSRHLAQAYALSSHLCRHGAFARRVSARKRESCRNKALTYAEKALALSRSVGDRFWFGRSNLYLANAHVDILVSTGQREIKYFKEALECGRAVKDSLLIADAMVGLEFSKYWRIISQEDPEKALEEYRKLCNYGNEAIKHYSAVENNSGIAMAYTLMVGPIVEVSAMETDLPERLRLIETSVQKGYKGLEHAKRSRSMQATSMINFAIGNALTSQAIVEEDAEKKADFLSRAIQHVEECISIQKKTSALAGLEPIEGNLALAYWSLALSQADLAKEVEKSDEKTKILKASFKNIQIASDYWGIWIESPWTRAEKPHMAFEGTLQMESGRTLHLLYSASHDETCLKDSVKAFKRSVEANEEADLPSRAAAAHWQIARTYDILAKHAESAASFELASEKYRRAAEKLPQLAGFFMDHAIYMKAWSETEKARRSHFNENYENARKHYEKTAALHNATKRWSHLSTNYYAWSTFEAGLDKSQKEQTEEARVLFQRAGGLFAEAKKSIQAEMRQRESVDEKLELSMLVKASDIRIQYCSGRIALEEARILDSKGNHSQSARKYAVAAEIFEKVAVEVQSELERLELKFTIHFCRGWQNMVLAEAGASPELYGKASQLFQEARNYSSNERAKKIALGHSRFARALEAGTKLEDTRDLAFHSVAAKHLESAAGYYLKAGLKTASEYVKATQRLFDAYLYMDKANREAEPERKAKYYLMAEKVLQTSKKSYKAAKQPEKSNEVEELLGKAREEREFASLLSDILHKPSAVSTQAPFSAPTITQEKALGLERFEHADVQASLDPGLQETAIGEEVSLRIQIANVGKGAASIVKIHDVVPDGFDLVKKPEAHQLEDSTLTLDGKRLASLRTEEVDLILRPRSEGTFIFKPRISYVDESGKRKLCQPEPARIKVSRTSPTRISSGYKDLDNLLFGGIPRNYAVVLTSPPTDERDLLIRDFIEAGTKRGEVTFYFTTRASGIETLAEKFPAKFFLFLCNEQADSIIRNLPNVSKFSGVQNLTDISIALTSKLRTLADAFEGSRRVCVEIVSDVLLQHHAIQTRRWLVALIPELKSQGFTTLAVLDPGMHQPQEVHAVIDLFDGEINIFERETKQGTEKLLRIRRMYNQDYSNEETPISREKLRT
jgi:uncharacterized repeat protein (TIGR01451 family)